MLLPWLLALSVEFANAQVIDDFSGTITVTNNGISPVPSFSLGEPALLLYMRMARKRWSFEPVFRINLENANPWTFDFPVVYEAVDTDHFNFTLGFEPSMNFQVTEIEMEDRTQTLFEARKYLGLEVGPTFKVTSNWNVGFFYFGAVGFDAGPKNLHFLSLSTSINDIRMFRRLYFSLTQQVFHLRVDEDEGYYTALTATLKFGDSPFSLTGLLNKNIGSEIVPEQNLIWNVSLSYTLD